MFSSMLSYLRKRKGLTQDALAKELGIARSTLGMYERGLREPDFETLEAIADYFNVNMSTLLGENNTRGVSETKQKLLDAVDAMTEEQLEKLMKLIELVKDI